MWFVKWWKELERDVLKELMKRVWNWYTMNQLEKDRSVDFSSNFFICKENKKRKLKWYDFKPAKRIIVINSKNYTLLLTNSMCH